MIHTVRLSQVNRIHLSEIVCAQMDLLLVAAHQTDDIDRETFENCLNEISNLTIRNQKLIHWLFDIAIKPREHLLGFINGTNGQEFLRDGGDIQREKITLVKLMRRDVGKLYTRNCIETFEFYMLDDETTVELPATRRYVIENLANRRFNTHFPDWLRSVKDFCIYFYENLSSSGLNEALFSQDTKFSRDDYFYEFEQANPNQFVCAICDEHDFTTILRGKYHSDIEHYFPKDVYPHLSCHPYNLIPICGPCNTAHLNKDPLMNSDGTRKPLNNVFLPYRDEGVQEQGAIKFEWTSQYVHETEIEHAVPGELKLRIQKRTDNDPILDMKLIAFSEIYDIPNRWENRIHQIGDQMWRSIHHFIMAEFPKDEGFANPDFVQFKLNQLMTYLFDDLGKSPWVFVILWWIGNSVVEDIENFREMNKDFAKSPLLQTVNDMAEVDATIRKINQEKTNAVLQAVREFIV